VILLIWKERKNREHKACIRKEDMIFTRQDCCEDRAKGEVSSFEGGSDILPFLLPLEGKVRIGLRGVEKIFNITLK
jgi:hypothetical protein